MKRSQFRRFSASDAGSAIVEFALLAPVLLMLLIGMFQFGLLINNYIQVTEAVRVGVRTLAISRGASTPIASTKNAVYASAPGLTQGSFTFTITVNGNGCNGSTTESTCAGYLTSGQGQQATLTAAYNCNSLVVFGTNYLPSCSLSSTSSARIE
jgi:Flp pilus assembly protein TadG